MHFNSEIIDQIINLFGYNTIIILKDITTFLSGVFLTSIFFLYRTGEIVQKIDKVKTMDKTLVLHLKNEGHDIFFTNAKTKEESVYIMFKLIFSTYFKKKRYSLRNDKKVQYLLKLLLVLFIINTIIALFLMSFIILPTAIDNYTIYWRFQPLYRN